MYVLAHACPASLHRAGIRLCKAQRKRYKHMDLADLEEQLKATASARTRLIVTDGVFSMDGDVAPLKAICDLADKYASLLLYRWVPKFWTYGSVCYVCAQRPGSPCACHSG